MMHGILERASLAAVGDAVEGFEPKALIEERHKTHGSFTENATISQELKDIASGASGYPSLSSVHREALDMIFLKISRILSGHSTFKDHWDDIAGYAVLGAEGCEE